MKNVLKSTKMSFAEVCISRGRLREFVGKCSESSELSEANKLNFHKWVADHDSQNYAINLQKICIRVAEDLVQLVAEELSRFLQAYCRFSACLRQFHSASEWHFASFLQSTTSKKVNK